MKSGETGAKTRRHQLGFSLIEAAVALSIVGLAATGLWQAMGGMWARESVSRAQSHMARAEAAERGAEKRPIGMLNGCIEMAVRLLRCIPSITMERQP